MDILNLVLKNKWYDLIESGIKKEEYREIKQFFIKRFCQQRLVTPEKDEDGLTFDCYASDKKNICPICVESDFGGIKGWWNNNIEEYDENPIYDEVCFHRGYTKTTMAFKIGDITIGKGNKEWGAPAEDVFIIKLGRRIK